MTETLMKELNNRKLEHKKIKLLKSKSKPKHGVISFSRALEGVKQPTGPSKNKENKSRAKLVSFKGKETIKSRNKLFKTEHEEDSKKGINYGHPEKSSSRSKKLIT